MSRERTSIEELSGLAVALEAATGVLSFGEGVGAVHDETRQQVDIESVLRDGGPGEPSVAYRLYRGVRRLADDQLFSAAALRYDLTVTLPGSVGREHAKTAGHYHPKDETGLSFAEIYEVVHGRAAFVLQRVTDVEADEPEVLNVWVQVCDAGDRILIPPDCGHVTVNLGAKPLVVADLVSLRCGHMYGTYRACRGAAYYVLQDRSAPEMFRLEANARYGHVPPPEVSFGSRSPSTLPGHIPLYTLFSKIPPRLTFYTAPAPPTPLCCRSGSGAPHLDEPCIRSHGAGHMRDGDIPPDVTGSRTLFLGEVVVDLICERHVAKFSDADSFVPHVGGATANTAISATRNGANVALAGAVGRDEWGEWVRTCLVAEGVDVRWLRTLEGCNTPIACVIVDDRGEPTFAIYGDSLAAAMQSLANDIEDALTESAAPLFTSNTLTGTVERDITKRARSEALRSGKPMIIDANLRLKRWTDQRAGSGRRNRMHPRLATCPHEPVGVGTHHRKKEASRRSQRTRRTRSSSRRRHARGRWSLIRDTWRRVACPGRAGACPQHRRCRRRAHRLTSGWTGAEQLRSFEPRGCAAGGRRSGRACDRVLGCDPSSRCDLSSAPRLQKALRVQSSRRHSGAPRCSRKYRATAACL